MFVALLILAHSVGRAFQLDKYRDDRGRTIAARRDENDALCAYIRTRCAAIVFRLKCLRGINEDDVDYLFSAGSAVRLGVVSTKYSKTKYKSIYLLKKSFPRLCPSAVSFKNSTVAS